MKIPQKLQQHYAHHAMLGEQQEYVREGLEWSSLSFSDNRACVELIEGKPTGVLSLLDEGGRQVMHAYCKLTIFSCRSECVMPKATPSTFLLKLTTQHAQHPNFGAGASTGTGGSVRKAPSALPPVSAGSGAALFSIRHYAGDVTYNASEFLTKVSFVSLSLCVRMYANDLKSAS